MTRSAAAVDARRTKWKDRAGAHREPIKVGSRNVSRVEHKWGRRINRKAEVSEIFALSLYKRRHNVNILIFQLVHMARAGSGVCGRDRRDRMRRPLAVSAAGMEACCNMRMRIWRNGRTPERE